MTTDRATTDPLERVRSGGRAGLVWTAALSAAWVALAIWRPTTTWHLAPLLLGAAWGWVVGQDLTPGDRLARGPLLLAGVAGIALSTALAFALDGLDLLRGPTLTGPGSALREAVLLGVLGAALATVVGLVRTIGRTVSAIAHVGSPDHPVAVSDRVVLVEGNAYFPLDSVTDGALRPSRTHTVCPWKGWASYYDVVVDGTTFADAAWTYRHPLPLARRVKGRVAFWNGVQVDADDRNPR